MNDDLLLSELERDALTELVNIGVSCAAVSLRKMVGEQVFLTVPALELIDRKAAAALLSQREQGDLVAVQQAFSGAFCGRALLVFPEAKSLNLVRAVVGDHVAPELFDEIEQEALAETGNIILNGCLGTIANMLRRSISMSLPEVLRADGHALFGAETSNESVILFLYINFTIRERDIRGYIALLMDMASMAMLRQVIAEFIAEVLEEGSSAGAVVP
ncbi:chemotaxis protein CheX [Rhodobacter sp. NSM]|uniref:chemotaxis protein CheX n=1 Tax=Rhodobacter sp. NSM TaxID=3457501 RepID=UPI003FD1D590